MKERSLFYNEMHVAGRRYHEADLVWDKLKVGTRLQMVLDTDIAAIDPNAIALVFTDNVGEQYVLGYIPRSENAEIAAFLKMGWARCFECRISAIKPEAHYEDQLHVSIRIVRNLSLD